MAKIPVVKCDMVKKAIPGVMTETVKLEVGGQCWLSLQLSTNHPGTGRLSRVPTLNRTLLGLLWINI
jgi:hypothetical protein